MSIPQNISIISVFFTNQMVTDPDEDLLLFVVGMLQAEEGKERWVNWDGQENKNAERNNRSYTRRQILGDYIIRKYKVVR